jgi:hypothetical protein
VSGQVTQHGQLGNAGTICFDSGSTHCAYCTIRRDGSFEFKSVLHRGLVPGRYSVHFYSRSNEALPTKLVDSATSGLEIEVAPGWNQFIFDLL